MYIYLYFSVIEHEYGRTHDVKVLEHCSAVSGHGTAVKRIACPVGWSKNALQNFFDARCKRSPQKVSKSKKIKVFWGDRLHLFTSRHFGPP